MKSLRIIGTDSKSQRDIVFFALCALVFLAGWATINPFTISFYEKLFIFLYFLYLYSSSSYSASSTFTSIKKNWIVWVVGIAWFLSVTVSLFLSPLGMATEPGSYFRYEETITHVVFFVILRDFLGRHQVPVHWLLIAIPASCLVVALGMAYFLLNADLSDIEIASEKWFLNPGFHAHVRHTGYQITAGIAVLAPFFLRPDAAPVSRKWLWTALIILLTLLFWMGGRGSILSVFAAFVLLCITLMLRGVGTRDVLLAFAASVVLGLALSEWLAIFPWNGVFSGVLDKSLEAGSFNELSTGRLELWRSVWESVRNDLAFGLGPQSYIFMPNHIFGMQPHSAVFQFLVEWGLVGGLLFAGLVMYAFYRGLRVHVIEAKGGIDIAPFSVGTMIVALSIHGFFDGTFYHPQPSLYLAIGFAIWTLPKRKSVMTPGHPRNQSREDAEKNYAAV